VGAKAPAEAGLKRASTCRSVQKRHHQPFSHELPVQISTDFIVKTGLKQDKLPDRGVNITQRLQDLHIFAASMRITWCCFIKNIV
jgi:hypothetical protein